MVSTRSRTSNVKKIIQPNDAIFDKDLLKLSKIKNEPNDEDLNQHKSTEQCLITIKLESDIKEEPISDAKDEVDVIDPNINLKGETLRRKPERISRNQKTNKFIAGPKKDSKATNKSTRSKGRKQRLTKKRTNLKTYSCKSCGNLFQFYGELQCHHDCWWQPKAMSQTCVPCKKGFSSLHSLK